MSDVGRRTDVGIEQVLQVERYVRHPQFNPQTFYNDIALVFLTEAVQFSANVSSAALPTAPQDSDVPDGTVVIAAGYGAINVNSIRQPSGPSLFKHFFFF